LAVIGAIAVAGGVTGALGSLPSVGLPAATDGGAGHPTPDANSRAVAPGPSRAAATPTLAATPTPASPSPKPPAPTTPATPEATPAPTPVPQRTYVVQEGDTLHDIALRFGTTVEAIQRANGLADSDLIVVGQRLLIP
jgi:LysM repeat protein